MLGITPPQNTLPTTLPITLPATGGVTQSPLPTTLPATGGVTQSPLPTTLPATGGVTPIMSVSNTDPITLPLGRIRPALNADLLALMVERSYEGEVRFRFGNPAPEITSLKQLFDSLWNFCAVKPLIRVPSVIVAIIAYYYYYYYYARAVTVTGTGSSGSGSSGTGSSGAASPSGM